MTAHRFTLHDLRRVLMEGAGADDAAVLDGDILDTAFIALGYESLAMLETAGRVEREWDVCLDDVELTDDTTPRQLIDAVNERIAVRA
ncbi:phosphopantetheine-binding protein [Streptomyces sp. NPDC059740]|uniref:phosphopantetheine-binding protein n=1 Tax=Streptomyces sp. NPDC059740 TaxID=3346926 RepID=UPI00364E7339